MGLLLQALVDGILIGGIYGLIGIGLTLIFGVMKIINFAQGALMMLGMYVTYYLFIWFGLNPYLSLPFSAIALFLLGALIQRGVLDRVLDAPEHNQLLVTMGLMLIIENAALVLFSPDFRTVKVEQLSGVLTLGNVNFEKTKLIAFLFALLLTVVLYWFLQKTYLGKAIRAVSIDRDGAALSGIQVRRVNMITFGIGAGLAAVAGTLITPFLYITPSVGEVFILKAFVVVVLGGLGNFFGALAGGLIIGVSESLTSVYIPGNYKELATFLIFILVLLFRPTGLFGRKVR
ncbi:MAG: branched-chain amino acid ABC transporter permease [Bacillaceae bacterium G1]|nr:branched-chain amino acid ABC transporter permease [Bacillota bacterium]OJF18287.1 MAG: branched-chain amino acid ABC transporter permease [Bacillaceae bacterium G1]